MKYHFLLDAPKAIKRKALLCPRLTLLSLLPVRCSRGLAAIYCSRVVLFGRPFPAASAWSSERRSITASIPPSWYTTEPIWTTRGVVSERKTASRARKKRRDALLRVGSRKPQGSHPNPLLVMGEGKKFCLTDVRKFANNTSSDEGKGEAGCRRPGLSISRTRAERCRC